MSDIIQINKFKDPFFLPHGLNFSITKLNKIDEHLYSFYIKHPTCKYLDFTACSSRQKNGIHFTAIEMVAFGDYDEDKVTQDDYRSGKVKGGAVKIRYYNPVRDILLHYVPLKWETIVFIIAELNDFDIWEMK